MPVAENADAVRVRVPAKVNLHLSVGPVRDDGYHDITTVFQAVTVYDDVVARDSDVLQIRASGAGADGIPLDHHNLAWQAASLLAHHANVEPTVLIDLHKQIPVAGGMAGGSADAAAALLACAVLWRTGSSKSELAELAAQLGADVAFPLTGGTALGTGRGEQLTPVLTTGLYHWVFATSPFGISAGAAYRELDRLRADGAVPPAAGSPDELIDALRSGDSRRLAPLLCNDLQAAALSLHPELLSVLETGQKFGALAGIVSGSGPTCAFLCADAAAATTLARDLEAAELCHTTHVATAPTHGARVMV